MIKKYTAFLTLLLLSITAFPQSPGTYKHKGKTYFVYPYRLDGMNEIPLLGYGIPDGDYIAFTVFNFKENFSFKKRKTFHLTDTTVVAAVFTIKKNLAEGPATFYQHSVRRKGKERKTASVRHDGSLSHNLKTGAWSSSVPGKKPYQITHYKNGIRHGYHTTFLNGLVLEKESYFEGDLSDTTFIYRNGIPELIYDPLENPPPSGDSHYERGLTLLNVLDASPKTFYKKYDRKGKIIFDLKFSDGRVLPYDSIGRVDKKTTEYIKINHLQNGETRVIHVYDDVREKNRQTEYYSSYLYRIVNDYIDYKVERNAFTGKHRRTVKDSFSVEDQFIDPAAIKDSSLVPVLAKKHTARGFQKEEYYIPAYQFSFEKDENSAFMRIDTARRLILLQKKTAYRFDPYSKRYEAVHISNDDYRSFEFKDNPYLDKDFIVEDQHRNFVKRPRRYNNKPTALASRNYLSYPTNEVYYKNDTVLNGRYYFTSARKYKHWPADLHYSGYTRLKDGLSSGSFVNGKKEALWTSVVIDDLPKITPVDMKAFAFAHPGKCFNIREETYKNGMRDGACTEYTRYDPSQFDDNDQSPEFIFKETEYSYTRDTLNGMCRSFYENGRQKSQIAFLMGSVDGEATEYEDNGQLRRVTHFVKGKLDGPHIQYRYGVMSCFANFKNNLLSDSLVYYYDGKRGMKFLAKNDTLLKRISYFNDGKVKELIEFSAASGYRISENAIGSDNFIEIISQSGDDNTRAMLATYRNYYDTGQLLSEGEIKNGALSGLWKFYAINGVMIHEVNFTDTLIHLPNDTALTEIAGFYKSFYITGAKRCSGYLKDLELSYDCFTKQDKANPDFYPLDFFDMSGKPVLKNGNGYFISYDVNGSKVSEGKVIHCREDSLWKYYSPEQKLQETGNFANGKKEGVWYEGSLEGINFEDGVCFDMTDSMEAKAFEASRKHLSITRIIYRNGRVVTRVDFQSNTNKTYEPGNPIILE